MPSKVTASNLHKRYKLDERFARNIAVDVLKLLKKEGRVELELIFVDDKSIKKFNRQYKHHDDVTDVLSFGIDRAEFGKKIFLGQIIISLDTARRNSRIFGTRHTDEIALYIIHGILHLFGYDDGNAKDRRRMSKKQESILERLQACKNLSKVLMPR